jgi:hypothetical protein
MEWSFLSDSGGIQAANELCSSKLRRSERSKVWSLFFRKPVGKSKVPVFRLARLVFAPFGGGAVLVAGVGDRHDDLQPVSG